MRPAASGAPSFEPIAKARKTGANSCAQGKTERCGKKSENWPLIGLWHNDYRADEKNGEDEQACYEAGFERTRNPPHALRISSAHRIPETKPCDNEGRHKK